MRTAFRRIALLSAVPAFVLGAAPAAAQEVQYTTVSKADMGSVINALARLGGGLETRETTYIKGGKMRTDVDKMSTIMDFEAGRYIWINHDDKTYSVVTFEQMLAQMEQAASQARAAQIEARGGEDETTIKGDSGEVRLEFKLDVDRTGESQKVNGWGARRAFITMTTDATVKAEDEEEAEAGSLIVFVDMWASTDVPVYAAERALHQNAAAQAYLGKAGNAAQGIGAAFAGDPQMSAAMRKAGEEMQKIDGAPVKTTTYLVALAPDTEFDRDLVLNPKKESAAKKIGGSALRGALGRLGQKKEEDEEKADDPTQKTMFTFTSEIRDAKTGNVSDSLFEPPAGYREVQPGSGN